MHVWISVKFKLTPNISIEFVVRFSFRQFEDMSPRLSSGFFQNDKRKIFMFKHYNTIHQIMIYKKNY
jgi:hypothetical protein